MLVEKNISHISFARPGGKRWVQAASRIGEEKDFVFLDCAHHRGCFYTVTSTNAIKAWNLICGGGPPPEPKLVVPHDDRQSWETKRYLASAQWGALLLVRKQNTCCDKEAAFGNRARDVIAVDIVSESDGGRLVEAATRPLCGHALLLAPHGDVVWLDAGALLPGLGANCVYIAAAREEKWVPYHATMYDLEAETVRRSSGSWRRKMVTLRAHLPHPQRERYPS